MKKPLIITIYKNKKAVLVKQAPLRLCDLCDKIR